MPALPMMALKRSGWSEWRSYCGRRNCYVEMTSISVNEWFLTGKWMEIRKKVVRDGGCLNIFYYLCPRYIIKNSNIMSRIQSGPYQETLHTIETVQLCQNQSYQIVEWEWCQCDYHANKVNNNLFLSQFCVCKAGFLYSISTNLFTIA